MDKRTTFNKDNDDSFFFVRDNMMLEQNLAWNPFGSNGKHDALWRTSLAYITYGDRDLKSGIMSCFEKRGSKIVGHRYPGYGSEDFSRDQLTMALCALKLKYDSHSVKEIVDNIGWRISNKFRLTLGLWVWMQSIAKDTLFLATLFSFMKIIPVWIQNGLNKLIYTLSGLEPCSIEEQAEHPYREITKKEEIAMKLHFPSYAQHILAWQVYILRPNPLKKILQKVILKGVPKWNIVVRLLLDDDVFIKDIYNYKPMSGYPWQNSVFKGLYNMAEIIEYHHLYKDKYANNENVLDNDVVWYLYERKLRKSFEL